MTIGPRLKSAIGRILYFSVKILILIALTSDQSVQVLACPQEIRPEFFIRRFTNPPTVISHKANSKIIFYILPTDSKYYLFR